MDEINTKKHSNVTVVIRSSNEKTVSFLKKQVLKEVISKNVYVINEIPFSKALEKNFILGIENKTKWTLALDGDLILAPKAISIILESAKKYGDKLYVYQGYILDKFMCSLKRGGPHLYLTSNLKIALSKLNISETNLRPESNLYGMMEKIGYDKIIENKVFALHDFSQSQDDIFRKGYFHGVKHKPWKRLVPEWLEKSKADNFYEIAVKSFIEGYFDNPKSYPDTISLQKKSQSFFKRQTIELNYDNQLNENIFEEILDRYNFLYNDDLDIISTKKTLKMKIKNKLKRILD